MRFFSKALALLLIAGVLITIGMPYTGNNLVVGTFNLLSGDGYHTECVYIDDPVNPSYECQDVPGEGDDQCTAGVPCTHNVCVETESGPSCRTIFESGTDECSEDWQCGEFACVSGQCQLVTYLEAAGRTLCGGEGDNESCGHRECTASGTCEWVPGAGEPDKCSDNKDCGHYKCEGASCKLVAGKGDDECSEEAYVSLACSHKACKDGQCLNLPGKGDDECSSYRDCGSRMVCDGIYCTQVEGTDPDECAVTEDCNHKDCVDLGGYMGCIFVPGDGEDKCSDERQCGRLGCVEGICRIIPGQGPDECSDDEQCSHFACDKGQCISVPGEGDDQCDPEDDKACGHRVCGSEGSCTYVEGPGEHECALYSSDCSHLACDGEYCNLKPGKGEDECDSDNRFSCGHLECREGTCTLVPGQGENSCDDEHVNSCRHFECRDGACLPVPGVGADTCSHSDECSGGSSAASMSSSSMSPSTVSAMSAPKEAQLSKSLSAKAEPAGTSPSYLQTSGSMLGKQSAKVTVEIFQDIGCGMCRYAMESIVARIIGEFVTKGQVKIEFKEFPLGLRSREVKLAGAAQCAGEQGAYLDYLLDLYSIKKDTDVNEAISSFANKHKLEPKFSECILSGRQEVEVKKMFGEGQKRGVKGTPTFFINGRMIPGAQPYNNFQKIIQEELAKTSGVG